MKKFQCAVWLSAVAFPLLAGSGMYLKCESKQDFRAASREGAEYIVQSGNGKEGKCFLLTCPADKKRLLFHPWAAPMAAISNRADTVRIQMDVKGSGTMEFGCSVYDAQVKPIPSLRGNRIKLNLDSPDRWRTLTLNFTARPDSLYAKKAARVMPFLQLYSGARIHVDNIRLEFLPADRLFTTAAEKTK